MKFNLMRFTNIALLALVGVLTFTGVYGLFWTLDGWLFDVHRAAAWALIAAIPWKVTISLGSLKRGLRPDLDRGVLVGVSLLLAAATLLVLGLGVLWNWRLGPESYWLRQTAISWHWMLALGLLVPFFIHVWRRWPKPKQVDFVSRRAALKMLTLGAAGLVAWRLAEVVSNYRMLAGNPPRFTGSRLDGYLSGNRYPVTQSAVPDSGQINPSTWRLSLSGALPRPVIFTYDELLALPQSRVDASLDCTLGWYTTQTWDGVPLYTLLEMQGLSDKALGVLLVSVTGYTQYLPLAEAKEALLATHVGEERISPDHGFPLRVVVPSRRGWFWVKWLSEVRVV